MNVQILQGVVQGAGCDGDDLGQEEQARRRGPQERAVGAGCGGAAAAATRCLPAPLPLPPAHAPASFLTAHAAAARRPLQLDDGACLWDEGCAEGRTFKFWVADARGGKLDYGGMSALCYTLTSVLGYRSHPTVPPDQELLLSARRG